MDNTTPLVWSDRFLLHDTGAHVEAPERLRAIFRHLEATGLLAHRRQLEPAAATFDDVATVHDPDYIRLIREIAELGGGYLDPDTIVGPASYEVALLAAGAVRDAVDLVLDGEIRRVFAFPRPPGHHAERGRGMGFCLFNNVALGARHAIDRRGLRRVAIIDWDVHHGNGTQQIFEESDQVLFVSLHQFPHYPGTGRASEQGVHAGHGYTLNLPLPPGSDDGVYIRAFDQVIEPRLVQFRPELILVSAGFDAHWADPLSLMEVSEEGFAAMAGRVRRWADGLCQSRLVVVLEGGYNLTSLADSVEMVLRELDRDDEAGELKG